jgi:hypothetical protein
LIEKGAAAKSAAPFSCVHGSAVAGRLSAAQPIWLCVVTFSFLSPEHRGTKIKSARWAVGKLAFGAQREKQTKALCWMLIRIDSFTHVEGKLVKPKLFALFLFAGLAGPALAVERYTEARIYQIETSDLGVFVFLQGVSGDAPPQGNGGSNEPLSKFYLILAGTPEDAEMRKTLIASAFVALTTNTVVRFRWDDATNRISHLLVRS